MSPLRAEHRATGVKAAGRSLRPYTITPSFGYALSAQDLRTCSSARRNFFCCYLYSESTLCLFPKSKPASEKRCRAVWSSWSVMTPRRCCVTASMCSWVSKVATTDNNRVPTKRLAPKVAHRTLQKMQGPAEVCIVSFLATQAAYPLFRLRSTTKAGIKTM